MSALENLPFGKNPGYHKRSILKGEVGELSKVYEELLEALDAEERVASHTNVDGSVGCRAGLQQHQ